MSTKVALGAGAIVVAIAASILVYRNSQAPERAARHPAAAPEGVAPAPVATAKSDADFARMRADLGLVQGQLRALQDRVNEPKAPEPAAAVEAEEPSDEVSLQERRIE